MLTLLALNQVTKDPLAHDGKGEAPGTITSDSLAAESVNSGGDFGANNSKATPGGQPSQGTTTNTTDTSGATILQPSHDANSRADDRPSPSDQLGGKDVGRGPTYNTQSASTTSSDSTAVHDTTTGGRSNAGIAPTYINAHELTDQKEKPKGSNLTEGEFAGEAKVITDIGGKKDPARLAEQKLAGINAQAGGDAGGSGPRQTNIGNENQYQDLGDTSA